MVRVPCTLRHPPCTTEPGRLDVPQKYRGYSERTLHHFECNHEYRWLVVLFLFLPSVRKELGETLCGRGKTIRKPLLYPQVSRSTTRVCVKEEKYGGCLHFRIPSHAMSVFELILGHLSFIWPWGGRPPSLPPSPLFFQYSISIAQLLPTVFSNFPRSICPQASRKHCSSGITMYTGGHTDESPYNMILPT